MIGSNIKIMKREKKKEEIKIKQKENSTKLPKPNIEAEVYTNNKK